MLEWPSLNRPAFRGPAFAVSVALHAVGVVALVLLAREAAAPVESSVRGFRSSTVLVAPPMELTQTAPNRGKVGKEFSLDDLKPRPALRWSPRATTMPLPPLAEPPKVVPAAANTQQPPPQLGSTQMPGPPPQIQTEERPKLAFQAPGVPSGTPKPGSTDLGLRPPGEVIADAAHAGPRAPEGSAGVSDSDLPPVLGLESGARQAPAAARRATALELLSDPGGVDFKPYLIRILATVKRNWQAVIPETGRLGRQGRVQVQFIIDRRGYVPKLVIPVGSGTESLDRAAVAGISASQPFPPFPPEFQGSELRLQLTFSYNMR